MCKSNTGGCQTPISDAWDGYVIEHMPDLIDNEFLKVHHQQNREWRRK